MAIFVPFELFALAALFQVHDVTSWSFLPIQEPVRPTRSSNIDYVLTTKFMCQADTPLTKCQVNAYKSHETVALIDLSNGSDSGVIRRSEQVKGDFRFNVRYNGTGLEHGQCGATFENITTLGWTHYGCRGADEKGEWHTMDFAVTGAISGKLAASITPREVVVMPGNNVSVLFKTASVLHKCFVNVGSPVSLYNVYTSVDARTRVTYGDHYRFYGGGPARGECGTTLINVTEKHNGPMRYLGVASDETIALRFADVIVASPPTETYLNVDKLKYSVGDTLTATCSSLLSRPVANLTWTLDDRIIRQDGIDDAFRDNVWSWPWDKKNITQRLTLILEDYHFGKKLECSVEHLALTSHHTDLNYLITEV